MKTTISISNIKCTDCANKLHKSLASIIGVFGVTVDMINGKITVDHTDEVSREKIVEKLLSMGYPEKLA